MGIPHLKGVQGYMDIGVQGYKQGYEVCTSPVSAT